jgi:hypothetical protein
MKQLKEQLQSCQQDLKHAQRIAQTAHNEANRKVRAGEARLQKHLCVAKEVMQGQVRMLRESFRIVRASAARCNGNCLEAADGMGLQLEGLLSKNFDFTGDS